MPENDDEVKVTETGWPGVTRDLIGLVRYAIPWVFIGVSIWLVSR